MAALRRSGPAALAVVSSLLSHTLAIPFSTRDSNYTTLPINTTTSISFSPCPSDLKLPPSLECATYSVPIDWDTPSGEHFDLGLVRLPARANSTTKIGSLFVNPGGPGGSATETVAGIAEGVFPLPDALFEAFDIIGLDPRGIGFSQAVQCDQSIWAERVSWFPDTQEDYDKLVDKNRRYGESCREKTGPLLEYLDMVSIVKDHEAVRIALDNKPLNMVGLSYGSFLGMTYASLFPDSIRTLAIDGLLQHSQADSSNSFIESSAYTVSLKNFFQWASTDSSSPLKGLDVESIWASLRKNASSPLSASACDGTTNCASTVNAEEILWNAQQALVFKLPQITSSLSTWGTLASALFNATTRGEYSSFSKRLDDHAQMAGVAMACLDWAHDPSVFDLEYLRAKKHMAQTFFPLTGGQCQTVFEVHSCIGWPYAASNPQAPTRVETDFTVLAVASDADPSTGYTWGVGALQELGNKVFVTRKGDGHTSFFLGGETAGVMAEYLITGEAPERGLFLES
ncbi:hypothetical protein EJ04DRAFT_581128 [Polyplosphaeria fusca]|uniref:AB hydrolase-1 domain-containing protein n=1 Tax=Polyplosphaeria fusca TaxID=682080 RepID=A0A9P4UY18_9PLEO|nr:hypothetical protein EJ04DRAFT_581128 [Polyplosphaeria fusca]